MGRLARSRVPTSCPLPSGPIDAREFQRLKMGSLKGSRHCSGYFIILAGLISFGLAVFIAFAFTLRTGHGTTLGESSLEKPNLAKGKKEMEEQRDDVEVYGYEKVREFHHDPDAFTQGFAYGGHGILYESTGLYGRSSVRVVDLLTGKVQRKHDMSRHSFGEGLTIWKNKLLQVVWKEKKVIIYDRKTLSLQGELSHTMQDGWGLATSNDHIIGSDGTSKLYFMDPNTFEEVKVLTVTDGNRTVGWLNELEFVNNEIWANIWQRDCVARISPQDGRVTGWILLHGLRKELLSSGIQVLDSLNGIAWDSTEDKVYVTGKLWPKVYEIRLQKKPHNANGTLRGIRNHCIIRQEGFIQ